MSLNQQSGVFDLNDSVYKNSSQATPFNFQERISSKIELDLGGHDFVDSSPRGNQALQKAYVSILNRGQEEGQALEPSVSQEMKTPVRKNLDQNMYQTIGSIISKEEDRALDSIQDFHNQYNCYQNVLNFSSTISKKDLFLFNKNSNLRMNEIHSKLRDPKGHHSLMQKNMIVTNRHREPDGTNKTHSRLNQASGASITPLGDLPEHTNHISTQRMLNQNSSSHVTNPTLTPIQGAVVPANLFQAASGSVSGGKGSRSRQPSHFR